MNVIPPLGNKKDDDQESGRGQSAPHSPKDFYSILGDIQISLCGFMNTSSSSSALASPNPTSSGLSTSISMSKLNDLNYANSNSSPQPPHSPSTSVTPLMSLSPNSNGNSNLLLSTSPTLSQQQQQQQPLTATTAPQQQSSPSDLLQIQFGGSSCNAADTVALNYEDLFQQYVVPADRFLEEIGTITLNPNLVIKVNGRYMNWQSASPIILAALVYQRSLSGETVQSIMEVNMSSKIKTSSSSYTNAAVNQQQPATQTLKSSSSGWGKRAYYLWAMVSEI